MTKATMNAWNMEVRVRSIALGVFLVSGLGSLFSNAAQFTLPQVQASTPGADFGAILGRLGSPWTFYQWDKGYLLAATTHGSPRTSNVMAYDQNGHLAREGTIWFPDAQTVSISAVAMQPGGALIAAGGTRNPNDVLMNFLAEVDTAGQVSAVLRISPFVAQQVCSAEDGKFWAIGWQRDALDQLNESGSDYDRLREFNIKGPTGRSAIKHFMQTGNIPLSDGRLFCSSDTVFFYNARAGLLFEYDLKSSEFHTTKITPLDGSGIATGFAVTPSGIVLASIQHRQSPFENALYRLVKSGDSTGHWQAIQGSVSHQQDRRASTGWIFNTLLGTLDQTVVFTTYRDFVTAFYVPLQH